MVNINQDIIAAIATAPGNGAVGIVRMSGNGVTELLGRMFTGSKNLRSHQMYYGKIHAEGKVIDEVMVCPMFAPRSYTKEDTVEIYAHGGMFVLRSVLDTVIKEGARLANPGEFTKRAFLNGRINLTQAEAVMDIINAETEAAHRTSLRKLGGGLSGRVEEIRNKILHWLAHIELSIDYPEHEEEAKNMEQILSEGDGVISGLESLLNTTNVGRLITDGIKTAIIGRPNAGKSTLLNAILSEDRAIVHDKPGTTRDILTERVVVNGVPLLLMDTAGIRETHDPVEKIGVQKSVQAAEEAELVLYLVDNTTGVTDEDLEMLDKLKNKILVGTKKDRSGMALADAINISAVTGEGMDELFEQIEQMFLQGIGENTQETEIITRQRHKLLLEEALKFVSVAMQEIETGVPEDLISINLRGAYLALGNMLGVEVADDILDRIFSEFCVGK